MGGASSSLHLPAHNITFSLLILRIQTYQLQPLLGLKVKSILFKRATKACVYLDEENNTYLISRCQACICLRLCHSKKSLSFFILTVMCHLNLKCMRFALMCCCIRFLVSTESKLLTFSSTKG